MCVCVCACVRACVCVYVCMSVRLSLCVSVCFLKRNHIRIPSFLARLIKPFTSHQTIPSTLNTYANTPVSTQVPLEAFDNGVPSLSNSSGLLRVTVVRNLFAPVFRPVTTVSLSQNALTGTVVATVIANDNDTTVSMASRQLLLRGRES